MEQNLQKIMWVQLPLEPRILEQKKNFMISIIFII